MSALETSQRTDEPETSPSPAGRCRSELEHVHLSQGKNCLGCRGCTLCQGTQIACRSWEMQVLSQQDWGATQDSVFLTTYHVPWCIWSADHSLSSKVLEGSRFSLNDVDSRKSKDHRGMEIQTGSFRRLLNSWVRMEFKLYWENSKRESI